MMAAKRLVNEILLRSPEGRDLEADELTALLGAYGIELWETQPVTTQKQAIAAGRALGWDVVLKATSEHLRNRPDLAHVWRNIDNAAEMRIAWASLVEKVADHPETAGFVVQKNSTPGVPIAIGGLEDPLFGPVVSFGVSGPLSELLQDRAYRIPPLEGRDAATMVREIRSAPMLFGYRGGEVVDVEAVERLIRLVAQLKNDLPQVQTLDLSLVLAGADGIAVLTAAACVAPVADPRSDWFVRRMNVIPGDTL
jgi:hypothetical protein